MIIKTNCFAYNTTKKKCIALEETACDDCSFYKTRRQQAELIKKYGWLYGNCYQSAAESALVCLEDDNIFTNYLVAAKYYGIPEGTARKIIYCCDGTQGSCGGFTFRWATTKEALKYNVITEQILKRED